MCLKKHGFSDEFLHLNFIGFSSDGDMHNHCLDGTFKVVQFFSIHAFLQTVDAMKQVPLAFIPMLQRRKTRITVPMSPLCVTGCLHPPHLDKQYDVASSSWSIYRSTVRTNNDCEEWHVHLNRKAVNRWLPLYKLIDLMYAETKMLAVTTKLLSEHKAQPWLIFIFRWLSSSNFSSC